jgi:ankyrin repeat protein
VWAANNGDLPAVRALLDAGNHNVDECDEDGSTALLAAAWSNHPDIVRLLLEHGADINAQNATVCSIAAGSVYQSKLSRFMLHHHCSIGGQLSMLPPVRAIMHV